MNEYQPFNEEEWLEYSLALRQEFADRQQALERWYEYRMVRKMEEFLALQGESKNDKLD